jgi:hypothetical protein
MEVRLRQRIEKQTRFAVRGEPSKPGERVLIPIGYLRKSGIPDNVMEHSRVYN